MLADFGFTQCGHSEVERKPSIPDDFDVFVFHSHTGSAHLSERRKNAGRRFLWIKIMI